MSSGKQKNGGCSLLMHQTTTITKSFQRRPNQSDIATAAKVSTATVSRVVNTSGVVSTEVRERVIEVMNRLGYYPNGAAQALANNKSWTIGAVVPTLENDLFARGINALMKQLYAKNYSLMVMSSDYSLLDEFDLVRKLLERGVDGLFLVGQERLPETNQLLEQSGRPYVETYISDSATRENHIGFSNKDASASLVDHLFKLGHRRFGMLSGITKDNDRALKRREGVADKLKQYQLEADDSLFIEIPYDIEAARLAFAKILTRPDRPTALICGNDLIAIGALIEARDSNFSIPQQMSIAGIDNHPLSKHTCPALTTIDIPAGQIGLQSADALVNAIESGKPIGTHEISAPLIIRQSTAPPPESANR